MDGWHDLIAGELPKLRMEKLEGFGFRRESDTCVYEEDLLDGDFHLLVRVTEDGVISTLLLDAKTEEPYVLHHVEQAQGAFVGEVRAAFWEVLNRIGESCGEYGAFYGAYVDDILRYVREPYVDEIEYPWKDMDAAVIRSHVTKKWYAVFMKILPAKIGLGGQKHIHVMNLHGTAEQVAVLVDGQKYFPGYHMNRKYWYTLCLDGSVTMVELHRRIDESFILSQRKSQRKTASGKD